MGLKTFRPLTPSLRGTVLSDFSEITKHKPEKKLTVARRRTGGRNHHGRMTSRGIGGGHKQRYRIIDFKRDKVGVVAIVEGIEYDPNRSARIALLKYADGEKRYIIAPLGLQVGAKLMSGPDAELSVGNALPLKKIIPGMPIHNVDCIEVVADRFAAARAWQRKSQPVKGITSPLRCRRVSFA